MKVVLMNKNTEVLLAELNKSNNFEQIYEYFNKEYSPLTIYNSFNDKSKSTLKALNEWYKGRGIPAWRKNLEKLLLQLNVTNQVELLDKAYGLSLSDQYWLKPESTDIKWEDINFFQNDFEFSEYRDASINNDSSSKNISLKSPNNTTDGMIQKAWVIEDNKRVLIKGTYTQSKQEPINEWLASQICKRLNIPHCDYQVSLLNTQIISKCFNFLEDNEEIISACDIIEMKKKSNNINEYEHYISILEEHGIKNAREQLSDMYIVDYLMMNTDRHMKNYGVIRNVETLKWEKLTPIFDTGQSLQCDVLTTYMNFDNDTYKFFQNTNYSLNNLIQFINLDKYDISKLNGLSNELEVKLREFQKYTDMSDERILKIVEGFEKRIKLLIKASE